MSIGLQPRKVSESNTQTLPSNKLSSKDLKVIEDRFETIDNSNVTNFPRSPDNNPTTMVSRPGAFEQLDSFFSRNNLGGDLSNTNESTNSSTNPASIPSRPHIVIHKTSPQIRNVAGSIDPSTNIELIKSTNTMNTSVDKHDTNIMSVD